MTAVFYRRSFLQNIGPSRQNGLNSWFKLRKFITQFGHYYCYKRLFKVVWAQLTLVVFFLIFKWVVYLHFSSLKTLMPPRDTRTIFHKSSRTFFMGKWGADPLQNLVTMPNSFTAKSSSPIGWPNKIFIKIICD